MKPRPNALAERFFTAITAYPKLVIAIGLLLILGLASNLPRLTKDASAEAFIPKDHASVIYRDQVREIFGLSDPVVIAVVHDGPDGVFNPETLALVDWLTKQVRQIDGVDPDRVTSLATENDIIGTEDSLLVEPFLDPLPAAPAAARAVRQAVMDFPLYLGSLVARDGSATLVVAELLDPQGGLEVYEAMLALTETAPLQGEVLHVAGEGAVTGYLGNYIDSDARRLNPMAALIISAVLFLAYRTARGVLLPNLVVIAAVATAVGSMAAAGVPFYVITNAMPVLLIAISVADGIHILGQYYEEQAQHPDASARQLTARALGEMWRPVTITSLTDIAGLLGLSLASYMPPMRAFGVFASLGVAAAWLFSLLILPSVLVLLRPQASRAVRAVRADRRPAGDGLAFDRFGRAMAKLGAVVIRHPGRVLVAAAVVAVLGLVGASRLQIEEARIENFRHSEPLYQADQAINQRLDGTNYLDIVIETEDVEGIFDIALLQRIEELQRFLETLPHVQGTTSVVDYLKQMNRALHDDRAEAYQLPDSPQAVAQYFLLYSASGDPTDFEEEVDYDYRLANVRASLDSGRYSTSKTVVEATEAYLRQHFDHPGVTANLAGRVNVDYHWIEGLANSHFRSLMIAMLAAWAVASMSFRSAAAGTLAIIPVALAVLLIYAVMGFAGIWLGVGTSMFAAIAIGTAVDFAVHALDRLIALVRSEGFTLDQALERLFPSTGRALLFNFSALLLGFGVLTTSHVPPLVRFGSLVGVAVSASFLASLTVLPALVKVLRPSFLSASPQPVSDASADDLTPSRQAL